MTDTPGDEKYVTWSPDGSRLAFTAEFNNNWQIFTINNNGDGRERLTNNNGTSSMPSYSPDGSVIFYESNLNGNWHIYSMGADGSNQVQVTEGDIYDSGQPTTSPHLN